jgi:[ribosomal protein S5]-alanine N-acetyltransferase
MIETERLLVKPLTYEQLVKYINCDDSLYGDLQLSPTERSISLELKEALEETILPNVADSSKNYLFNTLWTIIAKAENKMVGDICFVGEPDADGKVEIGYGTYAAFQSKGFMKEAVKGIVKWAFEQANIKLVAASTNKDNAASYSVVQKNGFVKISETEEFFNWEINKNNY